MFLYYRICLMCCNDVLCCNSFITPPECVHYNRRLLMLSQSACAWQWKTTVFQLPFLPLDVVGWGSVKVRWPKS